jgi:hypothetical protein
LEWCSQTEFVYCTGDNVYRRGERNPGPPEKFSGLIHTARGDLRAVDSAPAQDASLSTNRLQPSTAYESQEILWEVRGQIFSILKWAFWTALWIVSLAILGFFTIFFRDVLAFLVLDLLLGGALVGVFGVIFAILPARRAESALEEWEEKMLPFIYSVKFELLPAKGPDRLFDIWDRYKVIYRPLSSADVPRTGSRFYHAETLNYHSKVKGKEGRHEFDIYARVSDQFVLLVRRYSDATPVTLSEIQALKKEAEDVLKRIGPSDFAVGAFAASGFAPEAVSFCQSESGRVDDGEPVDLIQETAQGYAIVSLVTD